MKVVITIPAYNEEKTIGKVIRDIIKAMDKNRYNYQILVVDDGSEDKTAFIAKKAGAIVYSHPKNYGLAETFRTELEKCVEMKADVIVHIDADGQYLAQEIPKLVEEVEKGNDLVLGSRFKGKIEYMPLLKTIGNLAFSKVISNIIKKKITDGQTGFRAFTKDVAKKVEITSNHTYTQEQVIKAIKQKYKVKEVPVYFAKRKGKSRLIKHPLGYAAKAGINLIRIYRDYEPLKFFGLTGLFVLLIGFLIGIYLISLHFTGGITGHFPLIMFDILILSIGLQITIFGFLADMKRK